MSPGLKLKRKIEYKKSIEDIKCENIIDWTENALVDFISQIEAERNEMCNQREDIKNQC